MFARLQLKLDYYKNKFNKWLYQLNAIMSQALCTNFNVNRLIKKKKLNFFVLVQIKILVFQRNISYVFNMSYI